jgi:hypothetical protein
MATVTGVSAAAAGGCSATITGDGTVAGAVALAGPEIYPMERSSLVSHSPVHGLTIMSAVICI